MAQPEAQRIALERCKAIRSSVVWRCWEAAERCWLRAGLFWCSERVRIRQTNSPQTMEALIVCVKERCPLVGVGLRYSKAPPCCRRRLNWSRQMRRYLLRLADGGIDTRGVQDRSAAAIDGARVESIERHDPIGVVGASLRNDVEQRGPTASSKADRSLIHL